MATRKRTPDILADVLGEPSAHQHAGTSVDQHTRVPAYQNTPGHQAVERVKATFYLHPDLLDRLEEGWHRLRKLAKGTARGRVSKSLIVEVALTLALRDLETHGEDSQMAQQLGYQ